MRCAGRLELDFRVPGECELRHFGLAPRFVGTGAGRWLMNRAIFLDRLVPAGKPRMLALSRSQESLLDAILGDSRPWQTA
jgi:hypothetical protein